MVSMDLAICLRSEPVDDVVRVARLAEDLGYRELWLPDISAAAGLDDRGRLVGRDAFGVLAAVLSSTSSLSAGVGVAAMPMHTVSGLASIASTLTELSHGRFQLGIGVSHRELTARNGVDFPERPVEYMRAACRELRARSVNGMAFGGGWSVLLAALGPRMVQLAREEADGVVLNWLSPESVAGIVRSGRAHGTRTVLYLRLMMPDAARRDAADYARLANYRRHFRSQGLTDPDEIVDRTTLPADDVDAARARIDAYRVAGVDVVCLYAVGLDPEVRERLLVALAG